MSDFHSLFPGAPIDLILIRHGEKGYFKPTPEESAQDGCPEWVCRLSETGRMQSQAVSRWLAENKAMSESGRYVSDQMRAIETAQILAGEWEILPDLRERERLACGRKECDRELDDRLLSAFAAMRPDEDGSIVAVTHGGPMLRACKILEQLQEEELPDVDVGIGDAQVHWYTRRNPETGEISATFTHVLSVRPWDDTSQGAWKRI